jgi:hypothetical protein
MDALLLHISRPTPDHWGNTLGTMFLSMEPGVRLNKKINHMKKPLLIIFCLLLLFQCSDDETVQKEITTIDAPNSIKLIDVANSNLASDLQLSYNIPNITDILEFRGYVVKESAASSFSTSIAAGLASDKYLLMDISTTKARLPNSHTDIDGDEIIVGNSYVAFVMSVSSNLEAENALSNASSPVVLAQLTTVRTITDFIDSGSGGLSTDEAGNVYMSNFGTTLNGGGKEIFLITPEGDVSVFATGMNGASGSDFDEEGNLYQANINGGTILKITPTGQVTTFASGIQSPIGVAFDTDGMLYVSSCAGAIWKITPNGTKSLISSSALLNCPNGLDLDNGGNIYTSNFNDGQIIKIAPDGTASVFATLPGNNNAHLIFKGGLFYAAARAANQIYTINLSGDVTLFVGTGVRGIDDGPLSTATISKTNDFAFSPDGSKLYFNDKDPDADGNVISPVVIRVIDFAD